MQHIDDETLALLALGEDVLDDDARVHLATCVACAEAVAELGRVVEAFDGVDETDALVAPSPRVWSRVHTDLHLTQVPAVLDDVSPHEDDGDRSGEVGGRPGGVEGRPGEVVELAPRRRRRWVVPVAAACALVVGAVGGVLWERREVEPPETTIATAALEALPDWPDAAGEARVEERPDGRRQVVVTLDAPAPDGTFREVWLLAEDLSGLVSLGVLEGGEGRFDLPDGLDLARFPVVDVSEEHFDGDPSHSGDSVVRGPLDV